MSMIATIIQTQLPNILIEYDHYAHDTNLKVRTRFNPVNWRREELPNAASLFGDIYFYLSNNYDNIHVEYEGELEAIEKNILDYITNLSEKIEIV